MYLFVVLVNYILLGDKVTLQFIP